MYVSNLMEIKIKKKKERKKVAHYSPPVSITAGRIIPFNTFPVAWPILKTCFLGRSLEAKSVLKTGASHLF